MIVGMKIGKCVKVELAELLQRIAAVVPANFGEASVLIQFTEEQLDRLKSGIGEV